MPINRRRGMQAPLAVDVSVGYPEFFSVVAEGCIAGSAHPSATSLREQMEHLKEKENVRGLISVTEYAAPGHEELASVGVDYLHLPTADKCPLSIRDLVAGADFVDAVNATGGVVLVHCKEGIGRTGTMIAGWLVVSRRMDAKAAVDMVRAKRTDSIHQRHQELRIYQLHRVVGCEEHLAQVRAGTFDESTYDYRVLKAKCASVFARVHQTSFVSVYYFKWLRHVTDRVSATTLETHALTDSDISDTGDAPEEFFSPRHATASNAAAGGVDPLRAALHKMATDSQNIRRSSRPSLAMLSASITIPKYLRPVRSPMWKPKLDMKGYLASMERDCTSGHDTSRSSALRLPSAGSRVGSRRNSRTSGLSNSQHSPSLPMFPALPVAVVTPNSAPASLCISAGTRRGTFGKTSGSIRHSLHQTSSPISTRESCDRPTFAAPRRPSAGSQLWVLGACGERTQAIPSLPSPTVGKLRCSQDNGEAHARMTPITPVTPVTPPMSPAVWRHAPSAGQHVHRLRCEIHRNRAGDE